MIPNFRLTKNEFPSLVKAGMLKVWQAKSSSSKGRIISAFFDDVRRRLNASWVKPDYYRTQMIRGHGDFWSRIVTFGLVGYRMCVYENGKDIRDSSFARLLFGATENNFAVTCSCRGLEVAGSDTILGAESRSLYSLY